MSNNLISASTSCSYLYLKPFKDLALQDAFNLWNTKLNQFLDYILYNTPQYHYSCNDIRRFNGVNKDIQDLQITKAPWFTLCQSLLSAMDKRLSLIERIIDDKNHNHPNLQKISLLDLLEVCSSIRVVQKLVKEILTETEALYVRYQQACASCHLSHQEVYALTKAIKYNIIDIGLMQMDISRMEHLRNQVSNKFNLDYLITKIQEEVQKYKSSN